MGSTRNARDFWEKKAATTGAGPSSSDQQSTTRPSLSERRGKQNAPPKPDLSSPAEVPRVAKPARVEQVSPAGPSYSTAESLQSAVVAPVVNTTNSSSRDTETRQQRDNRRRVDRVRESVYLKHYANAAGGPASKSTAPSLLKPSQIRAPQQQPQQGGQTQRALPSSATSAVLSSVNEPSSPSSQAAKKAAAPPRLTPPKPLTAKSSSAPDTSIALDAERNDSIKEQLAELTPKTPPPAPNPKTPTHTRTTPRQQANPVTPVRNQSAAMAIGSRSGGGPSKGRAGTITKLRDQATDPDSPRHMSPGEHTRHFLDGNPLAPYIPQNASTPPSAQIMRKYGPSPPRSSPTVRKELPQYAVRGHEVAEPSPPLSSSDSPRASDEYPEHWRNEEKKTQADLLNEHLASDDYPEEWLAERPDYSHPSYAPDYTLSSAVYAPPPAKPRAKKAPKRDSGGYPEHWKNEGKGPVTQRIAESTTLTRSSPARPVVSPYGVPNPSPPRRAVSPYGVLSPYDDGDEEDEEDPGLSAAPLTSAASTAYDPNVSRKSRVLSYLSYDTPASAVPPIQSPEITAAMIGYKRPAATAQRFAKPAPDPNSKEAVMARIAFLQAQLAKPAKKPEPEPSHEGPPPSVQETAKALRESLWESSSENESEDERDNESYHESNREGNHESNHQSDSFSGDGAGPAMVESRVPSIAGPVSQPSTAYDQRRDSVSSGSSYTSEVSYCTDASHHRGSIYQKGVNRHSEVGPPSEVVPPSEVGLPSEVDGDSEVDDHSEVDNTIVLPWLGARYESAASVAVPPHPTRPAPSPPALPSPPRPQSSNESIFYDETLIYDHEPTPGQIKLNEDLTDVLNEIQREWPTMMTDDCIPVQMALQLMDNSSLGLGHRQAEFDAMHQQLAAALRAIVNEHHQGFNSSIGTFHKIQQAIADSQARIRDLKASLTRAKADLTVRRPELKALAEQSREYDKAIVMLNQIEELMGVRDKLEARITDKHFLKAVDIFQDAVKKIRQPSMDMIGALSDIRAYLANQEPVLRDIMIEELHNHLYLKSLWCQDRWKFYAKELSNGQSQDAKDVDVSKYQPLYLYLDDLDFSKQFEDAGGNPEANTFDYIRLLVESLDKLGCLDAAIHSIHERLPSELFNIVEKTNNVVDARHPSSLRGNVGKQKGRLDLGMDLKDARAVVLNDLLWSLYSKFEAIAEGHRVFHEAVIGVTKREGGGDGEDIAGSFKELWKLYQAEIKSLLHDYLATNDDMYLGKQAASTSDNVYKRGQRDKTKKIFRFADTDMNTPEMQENLGALDDMLQKTFPGLVSDSRRPAVAATVDSTQITEGAASVHKLIVEPNVFNMGLLLPPSLVFLGRLKDIVPPSLRDSELKISTLTSFLDNFLVDVFLPQLEDTIGDFSRKILESEDCFQEDPNWSNLATKPILRGATQFFTLITAFCSMLDTIPHDQAFSQLIINQMVTYYDQCVVFYKGHVSNARDEATHTGGDLKLSATLAAGPGDIHQAMLTLWNDEAEMSKSDRDQLLEKEVQLLIAQTNENPLKPGDVIPDRKTMSSLCMLYTSMRWLALKTTKLRHITEHEADSSTRRDRHAANRRWTFITKKATDGVTPSVYLPMTQETVQIFDGVVASYHELTGTILLTLHAETRMQTISALTLTLDPTITPYVLDTPVGSADQRILTLNHDLNAYHSIFLAYVQDDETSYICTGLAKLIDTFLVRNSSKVKAMNQHGCERMMLNTYVLQQNLRNIEDVVELKRARAFYGMFGKGVEGVLERAKEGKEQGKEDGVVFDYEELKGAVELVYSERVESSDRGVSQAARRVMGEKLLQLSGFMWQL